MKMEHACHTPNFSIMVDLCQQVGNINNMEHCFWRNETQYRSYYKMKVLGYMDLTFIAIAIISNAFVFKIFSRKSMTSPMNTIFKHIAITISLAGISYIPRAWHEFIRVEECSIPQHRTFIWELVSMYSYKAAFMFRHIAVWLAMMLAIWRYIAVLHPTQELRWCNPEITRKFIELGYVFGVLITIAPYFCLRVRCANKLLDKNGCSTSNYTIGNYTRVYELQVVFENYPFLYRFALIFYGLLVKLFPSVAFTFVSYKLMTRPLATETQRHSPSSQHFSENEDWTPKILVFILSQFVIGEVPLGIFCLLTAYYGPPFYWRYYYYGMEISNALTHVCDSFNFFIYYAMSNQFRKTYKKLILRNTELLRSIKIFCSRSRSSENSRSNEETYQMLPCD